MARGLQFELVTEIDAENPTIGDLRLVGGNFSFIADRASIRQHIVNRLRFVLGEWYLDRRKGFPYREVVLIKNPDLRLLRTLFRKTVLSVGGVEAVEDLRLVVNAARELAVSFVARLDDGSQPIVFSEFVLDVSEAA